jgi:hypothetical protein
MEHIDYDDPRVWLLLLERGRQTGDFALAAEARTELAKMGIYVFYGIDSLKGQKTRQINGKAAFHG